VGVKYKVSHPQGETCYPSIYIDYNTAAAAKAAEEDI
jgi:hypothetical protein